MNLQEMLDYTGGFYLDDRTNMTAGENDDLVADTSLVRLLNKAADEFARRTWRLQSRYTTANAAVTSFALVANQKDYDLNSRILRVLSVKLSDSDVDLRQIPYEDSRPVVSGEPFPYGFDINSQYVENPGRPSFYALDVGTRTIRLRNTPSTTETGLSAQMRVVHMPIVQLASATVNGVCEIEPEYHELLCMGAAGYALSAPNLDTAARKSGDDLLARFYQGCREARNDLIKMNQAMPRFRFGAWVRDGCR